MKIAYVTQYDPRDITYWSGLGHYIAESLRGQGAEVSYLGPLREELPFGLKIRRHLYTRWLGKKYLEDRDPALTRAYAAELNAKLAASDADIAFGLHPQTSAHVKCRQPLVLWSDATFAGLVDFYADYTGLPATQVRHGHELDRLALQRCRLAIFASDWAAQTAIRHYGVAAAKVKVVPFGANIVCQRTAGDVRQLASARRTDLCKLLFIGRIWDRKGGDLALEVARQLNGSGLKTELTLIGSEPPPGTLLPPFVRALGFVNKGTPEGRARFDQVFAESHFLILPSRAECFGVVFCEASSFGVPSLATNVGGIPGAVREGVNGHTFPLSAEPGAWCERIRQLMGDYSQYQALAASAFQEYRTRLNWEVSGRAVATLLREIL